jgi:hypothetical protein
MYLVLDLALFNDAPNSIDSCLGLRVVRGGALCVCMLAIAELKVQAGELFDESMSRALMHTGEHVQVKLLVAPCLPEKLNPFVF